MAQSDALLTIVGYSLRMSDFKDFLDPLIDTAQYTVTPLAGDASSRRYYRVIANKASWVLMEWEPFEKIGDFPFLSVQKYFNEWKVRVPEIIDYSKEKGLFLLEDLGDLTLERRFWEFQNQEVVLPFYEKALDELIKIHSLLFEDTSEKVCTAYHLEFDVDKLKWEMNYAKKYLIKELLQIKLSSAYEKELEEEFEEICSELYSSPQVICHRDFHSRNVMLLFNEAVIIDFQDARLGPPSYDLVSLFNDSYVNLNQSSIDQLMNYYVTNFPHFNRLGLSQYQWQHYYNIQSIQRCFKACGSFASFKVTRDDNRYLDYISPTLNSVKKLLNQSEFCPRLGDLLEENRNKWEEL